MVTPAMKGHKLSTVPSDYAIHLQDQEFARCPDCEARFPLQIVIADLLRKNQMLRMELQEARSQISIIEPD
jgi:hypothetical protein